MPEPKFVVSGNYLENNDDFRWLYREVSKQILDAVPATSITAFEVRFRESPKGEKGFGCSIVAYCSAIEVDKPIPSNVHMQAVVFNRDHFAKKHNGEKISQCKILILETNGDMFVVDPN